MSDYEATAFVPYADDLLSGYVVATRRGEISTAYWYGPDRSYGTTFGGRLDDHAVAVFGSKVKAQTAIRKGYRGGYPDGLKVVSLDAARRAEAARLERQATALLDRVARLRRAGRAAILYVEE